MIATSYGKRVSHIIGLETQSPLEEIPKPLACILSEGTIGCPSSSQERAGEGHPRTRARNRALSPSSMWRGVRAPIMQGGLGGASWGSGKKIKGFKN